MSEDRAKHAKPGAEAEESAMDRQTGEALDRVEAFWQSLHDAPPISVTTRAIMARQLRAAIDGPLEK